MTALLASERNPEVAGAAIRVLGEALNPAVRHALLAKYHYLDANGARRDPGGTLRAAILNALRPILSLEDVALLERAVTMFEFLCGEAAGDLRSAGLVLLNEVDGELAGYHAVRLLSDQHTSITSGEPAVTAVRVLATQAQLLPLYGYVMGESQGISDVISECLRNLVTLPERLLRELLEKYVHSEDEIVLLGVFDLLLARPFGEQHTELILNFVRDTTILNIHRYPVSVLVQGGRPQVIAAPREITAREADPRRLGILHEALSLR
ncbi:MAG: hypothetical protein M3P51_07200 [Chloroflexota bacterium]|nr:hypothetical protein [Chloroflexota bacterium]